jgi:hypothetical protein
LPATAPRALEEQARIRWLRAVEAHLSPRDRADPLLRGARISTDVTATPTLCSVPTRPRDHHVLELDDITIQSWARLDAHLTSPNLLVVHQLGPRRLWDEAVAAYDWWYDHDKPDLTRFGMTMTTDTQTVWLDNPSTVVRAFSLSPVSTAVPNRARPGRT